MSEAAPKRLTDRLRRLRLARLGRRRSQRHRGLADGASDAETTKLGDDG
jgi:hypothetical protein